MPTRRQLKFASFDEVIRDVEHLQAVGYVRCGQWNLAQITGHLADWLTYPVLGFPKAPLPIQAMLWVMRKTVGRSKFEKYIRDGMPAGSPTMPQSLHSEGEDLTTALTKLREAMARFQQHSGNYHPSPLFGQLTREESLQIQLGHCAHHLSFLIPKEPRQ